MSPKPFSAWSLFTYALAAAIQNFGLMCRLCILSALFIVLAVLASQFLPGPFEQPSLWGLVVLALYIAALIALTPAVTAWHRVLILGDIDRGDGGTYGWDKRESWYLARLILLIILAAIPGMVAVGLFASILLANANDDGSTNIMPASIGANLLISIILVAIYAFITARFGLALPAAAVGKDSSFGAAGYLIDRHILPLAGAIFIAMFLSQIVIYATQLFAVAVHDVPAVRLVAGGMFVLANAFTVFVSVGILSRAYWLLKQEAPGKDATQ